MSQFFVGLSNQNFVISFEALVTLNYKSILYSTFLERCHLGIFLPNLDNIKILFLLGCMLKYILVYLEKYFDLVNVIKYFK